MKRNTKAWAAQAAIWAAPGLSTTARLVALCILWHRNANTGLCCPSRERIASMTGTSVPTVRRAIVELKAAGVLKTTRTGQASRYVFCLSGSIHGYGVMGDPSDGSPVTYRGPFRKETFDEFEEEKGRSPRVLRTAKKRGQ